MQQSSCRARAAEVGSSGRFSPFVPRRLVTARGTGSVQRVPGEVRRQAVSSMKSPKPTAEAKILPGLDLESPMTRAVGSKGRSGRKGTEASTPENVGKPVSVAVPDFSDP